MTIKSLIAMRYWLQGAKWTKASAALELALKHHTGVRKDGVTPEFVHQLHVAHYVRTVHTGLIFPEETVTAAFLHDIREDYDLSDEEIRGPFGDRVADAVEAMTKVFRGVKKDPHKVFAEITANPIASVVKGADRIHNQHTCAGTFKPEKIREYIGETEEFILPMLKEARTLHFEQEPVYENLKFVLKSQVDLLRALSDETA